MNDDDDRPTAIAGAQPAMTMKGPFRDVGEANPTTVMDAAADSQEALKTSILDRGALGRFTNLEPLGAGGMGIVLSAHDPQLDRRVAIKILRTRGVTADRREKEAARLLREAKAMAQLSHPNVITVYEAGTVEEHVFIAMEYVAGKTLRSWLAEKQRTAAEIIDVYIKAGRGLAAGHAAGLVHRDFKPDNVLIGDDGRVRVIDFGLARGVSEGPDEGEPVRGSVPDVQSSLTTAGSLSGTPAYMAPEQHGSGVLDARTDQFAFCVSLFEALFRRLPFEGKNFVELVANVSLGNLRPIESRPDIPSRVTRAVVRGLSTKPSHRFGSMSELLGQLEPPAPRRGRVGLAVAVAALAAVAITLAIVKLSGGDRAGSTCTGGEERLAGVWDPAIKQQAKAGFDKSGRSHAAATFVLVEKQLDAYTAEWLERRRQICDLRAHKERSEAVLDHGMSCLDDRLEELGALTKLFAGAADPTLVDKAMGAAQKLPRPASCLDATVASAPLSPAQRVAVVQLRHDLAAARALNAAGKSADAYDLVKPLLDRATPLGYLPLQAELQLFMGQALSGAAKPKEAETALREAARLAARAKDDTLLAQSWMWLVFVIGFQEARTDEAITLAPVAEAAIERADGSDAMRGDLAFYVGSVHFQKGEYDLAQTAYERALAVRVKLYGERHPDVGQAENSLGGTLIRKGDLDGAAKHFEKAIEVFEATLGPNHPDIGRPLSNLAAVEQLRKQLEPAKRHLERAVKIFEEVMGPDHPNVGLTLNNLGGLERDLKDCKGAVEHYTRALAILEKQGTSHPYVAYPLVGRAHCLVELGRSTDAIADAERAITILAAQPGDPTHLAEARFALAKALFESGRDRARARSLVKEARTAVVAAGPAGTEQLAEIDAWAAKH